MLRLANAPLGTAPASRLLSRLSELLLGSNNRAMTGSCTCGIQCAVTHGARSGANAWLLSECCTPQSGIAEKLQRAVCGTSGGTLSGTSVSVTSSETLDQSDQPSELYARTEKKYDVLGSRVPKNCSQVCGAPPVLGQLATVTGWVHL